MGFAAEHPLCAHCFKTTSELILIMIKTKQTNNPPQTNKTNPKNPNPKTPRKIPLVQVIKKTNSLRKKKKELSLEKEAANITANYWSDHSFFILTTTEHTRKKSPISEIKENSNWWLI